MTNDDPSSSKPIHHGHYEVSLPVTDLERSVSFYVEKLGFEVGFWAEERSVVYLWFTEAETRWGLILFRVDTVVRRHGADHISFRVAEDDVDRMVPWLRERGIEPLIPVTGEPMEEPMVITWMPAAAVFFEDPDGNLIELTADLSDPPEQKARGIPLSEWRSSHE